MDLKEEEDCYAKNWMNVTQDRDQLRAQVMCGSPGELSEELVT